MTRKDLTSVGKTKEKSNEPTVLERWLNLTPWTYCAVLLLGFLIVMMAARPGIGDVIKGRNDYMSFYAGARLAGTPYLYDTAHVRQEQIKAVGVSGQALQHFVRLPFYAGLLSPLGKLRYDLSFWIWQSVSLGALLGFIFLWRVPNRQLTILACCWSFPLLIIFVRGQDVTLLLLLLSLVFQLWDKSPVVTGLVMSLFAIKFNLFLMLPLLLLGQRRWKMALGFLLGCAVLIAVSFAVAGPRWPADMLNALSSKAISPREDIMPNFRGLLQPFTDRLLPELVLGALAAAFVLIIGNHADFEYGMAAVIVGSLLVSHHAAPHDAALVIPALLIVVSRTAAKSLNLLCLILFTPVPFLMLAYGEGLGSLTVLLLSMLLFTMGIESIQKSVLPAPNRVSKCAPASRTQDP